jgi:hypothetical protein
LLPPRSGRAPGRYLEQLLRRLDQDGTGPGEVIPRAHAALLAGAVAIALNMAALAAAKFVSLDTGSGGLLKFLVILVGGVVRVPPSGAFQAAFHISVGLAMALFYAFALEPLLPGPSWLRGLLYAVAVWLANASIVLPVIGEGFAGDRRLTPAGMVWFVAAHTLFFVSQAILYARLRQRQHLVLGCPRYGFASMVETERDTTIHLERSGTPNRPSTR